MIYDPYEARTPAMSADEAMRHLLTLHEKDDRAHKAWLRAHHKYQYERRDRIEDIQARLARQIVRMRDKAYGR